ncbi:MAG: hypothetical protein JO317_09435 [Verrucomicrobiae bacterium]|nr:hypothetical protein [Verrucomicrobiae bacterium]
MGLPTETPAALAEQLLKRSRQIAEKRGLTQRQALEHLVGLLRQGWAAKNKSET